MTDFAFVISTVAFLIVLVCYLLERDLTSTYRAMWQQAEDDLAEALDDLDLADYELNEYDDLLLNQVLPYLYSQLAKTQATEPATV